MKGYLKNHPSAVETDSIEQNTLDMIAAYAKKKQGIVSTEHFRPLTQTKKEQILEMYQQTAEIFIKD
ncbi:hypothetical protein SDC9_156588 [bioreactor metagenome]|uniref:Uncharacterized protein n=1 Tax=bioreactor metagenome TaxID=1076179 RepID=A0A645F7I0_9ZZZZ